jgi:predicted transcriptional regulator
MATVKMTFSLDEATARRLNQTAERLALGKSQVVREAIAEYAERAGKIGEAERRRMLRALDEHIAAIPSRPESEVDRELDELRQARRQGGREGGRRGETGA